MMKLRGTERTDTQRRLSAKAAVFGVLLLALVSFLCRPVHGAPKAILFLSSAPTVRDVFEADAPVLQSLLTNGGVAVMTSGPPETSDLLTLGANGYVRSDGVGFGANGSGWLTKQVRAFGRTVFVGNPDFKSTIGQADELVTDTLDTLGSPVRARFERSFKTAAHNADLLVIAPIPDWVCEPSATAILNAVHQQDAILSDAVRAFPYARIMALPESGIEAPGIRWIAISNLRGHLTSDTTRTKGIVSNLDVAPTLIGMVVGKTPEDKVGHTIWTTGSDGMSHGIPRSVASAMRLQQGLGILEQVTDPTNYAIAFGAVFLILAGSLLSGGKGRPTMKRWIQRAILLAVATPLGVAISASRQPDSQAGYYLLAGTATFGLLAAFVLLGRALASSREDITLAILQIALGAFCAFVITDVVRHGMPLRLSPLSNFYQTGVRFYGLGNEYGSLFVAAFTMLGLLTVERSGAPHAGRAGLLSLGIWYTGCALLIGWPTLGANMGGLVIALVTGGVTWYFVAQKSSTRLPWLWPIVVGVAAFAAVVLFDAHSAHATHIGQFVSGATGHGRTAIIVNKVEMNARLLIQPVAWVLYVLSAAFAWWWWRRLGVPRRRAAQTYPWMALGVRSVLYGGLLALLTKDTGVVMLGLMAIVAIGIGVMLALEPPILTLTPHTSETH